MDKVLAFFESTMTEPTNYSWFHLMFIGIIIAAVIFFCVKWRNASDQTFRTVVLVCWVLMVVLEIYKQIIFAVEYTDGAFVWDYEWYAFPYQLCSTPLYALPFIIFLPEGKLRDAFIAYMSFFSFFGGIAVFFYPNDVFVETIGINVQTMIHHGLQVVLAVFFTSYIRKKYSLKLYLKSVPVFVGFLFIAMAVNIAVYHIFAANGIDDTFNMFYISPYFECTLPILSDVYAAVPYPVFALIYSLGFILIGFILYLIQHGIVKLVTRRKNA